MIDLTPFDPARLRPLDPALDPHRLGKAERHFTSTDHAQAKVRYSALCLPARADAKVIGWR